MTNKLHVTLHVSLMRSCSAALILDISKCLNDWISGKDLSFNAFKLLWFDNGLSYLHHSCPLNVNRKFWFSFVVVQFYSLWDSPNYGDMIQFVNLNSEFKLYFWNLGLLYSLFCFHQTRDLKEDYYSKIRITRRLWESFKLFLDFSKELRNQYKSSIGSQALRCFSAFLEQKIFVYCFTLEGSTIMASVDFVRSLEGKGSAMYSLRSDYDTACAVLREYGDSLDDVIFNRVDEALPVRYPEDLDNFFYDLSNEGEVISENEIIDMNILPLDINNYMGNVSDDEGSFAMRLKLLEELEERTANI